MGKKIIWSKDALLQLENIHFYILFETQSINIADNVIDEIFESTTILKTQPEIYKLDEQKVNNDGTFRAYYLHNFMISYQINENRISILRVRHTSRLPKKFP